MDVEYVDLLEDARVALFKLLKASEPGTGMPLHAAYTSIKISLAQVPREPDLRIVPPPDEPISKWQDQDEAFRARRAKWKGTPRHERERFTLEAIGDEALTVSEVAEALDKALDASVYTGDARTVLRVLVERGELDRVAEEFRGKLRYRYARKRPSGPIVALEREYQGGL